jgi:hypothetical protein
VQDEAADKEEKEVEEADQLHAGKKVNKNEQSKIVVNDTPSLDNDIPNRLKRQFKDKVTGAIDKTDGYNKTKIEETSADQ